METSLHKQLKEVYAGCYAHSEIEVPLDTYRIDVVRGDELVEIQHGALAAIRDKIADLLEQGYPVLVVKPIIAKKTLIKKKKQGGKIVSRRASPKKGTPLTLFEELVYFTRVFPHKLLTLETPLVTVDEFRYPGHGRRRRKRLNDFQVEDQSLVEIVETYRYKTAKDLLKLIPNSGKLPRKFDTANLAERMDIKPQ